MKKCDTEKSSGDEGDDEDEAPTFTDGPLNWLKPFRKIINDHFVRKTRPKDKIGE